MGAITTVCTVANTLIFSRRQSLLFDCTFDSVREKRKNQTPASKQDYLLAPAVNLLASK